jgi:uncharacterized membrane protein (DUF373 family)
MKLTLPDTEKIFGFFLKVIINILILYIIVILTIGLVKTIAGIQAMTGGASLSQGFSMAVTDILTFLVIIELFKGFVEYFQSKRFKLHSMLDPSILFVIREMIVSLYKDRIEWTTILSFAALILALAVSRTLAVKYSPDYGHEGTGRQ